MLRLIWKAHKVQKWTGNTASQGRLGIKFRESNKSRRIGQSPGSKKQTHPQEKALCAQLLNQWWLHLCLWCVGQQGGSCLPQKEIKGQEKILQQTEVKVELHVWIPSHLDTLVRPFRPWRCQKICQRPSTCLCRLHRICSYAIIPGWLLLRNLGIPKQERFTHTLPITNYPHLS